MKVNITSKGFTANERQTALIEKKFSKLAKFFPEDTVADVTMGYKKNRQTMEAMIRVKGMIFRSEYTDTDMNVCLDRVVNRLSSQISRYKKKIQKNHRHINLNYNEVPEPEEQVADVDLKPVKTKQFEVTPMDVEEAILQMEMLEHSFFVFLNSESQKVNVVYKRADGEYGLLDPLY
ncbi:MAG: ribosome-associated translation inhibitor RaiA [Firmicutes bacterium]|nr:ribosome-associated translation inhibitor RaiA [Bacillota bacterium]